MAPLNRRSRAACIDASDVMGRDGQDVSSDVYCTVWYQHTS